MNDILTNGTEIKQRIIAEIQKANHNIYVAMAFFTDGDIANAIIAASKRENLTVDIILSSNKQNETVKQMFKVANISVHAFETGDERGMMHHKFCLIDNGISINGSYNYSYNASNNNVENIQVSDDPHTYRQLYAEFERLKYNIDHQIDVNINTANPIEQKITQSPIEQPIIMPNFHDLLSSIIFTSANIDAHKYREKGRKDSDNSKGSINVFAANCDEIRGVIRRYATDNTLGRQQEVILQNIDSAFQDQKNKIDIDRQNELNKVVSTNEIEVSQIKAKISQIMQEKSILDSGNQSTGEKGLLQINNDIEKNRLEKKALEETFVIKRFWTVGTVFMIALLGVLVFYLSMFFASAMYKVFFEGNIIRNALEAGLNPGLPQIVDANAILKIFSKEGVLFGIMALFFFLIPVVLSNLKLVGSKKEWVNTLCFWVGIVVFDVIVSIMVAMNTDEIKNLLIGQESQLKIWQVPLHGEFWLIFVFGMLPLLITHFILKSIVNAYNDSQPEIVNAEKYKQIGMLETALLNLNMEKERLSTKIKEKEDILAQRKKDLEELETKLNTDRNDITSRYTDRLDQSKAIYDRFVARVRTGSVFTDEILTSILTAYKTGFIEYLPEFYAPAEVSNRVAQIEQIITNRQP